MLLGSEVRLLSLILNDLRLPRFPMLSGNDVTLLTYAVKSVDIDLGDFNYAA